MAYKNRTEFQNELWNRGSQGIQGAMGAMVQKKVLEKQRKQGLQDALKKAIIESQMKRMKPKDGFDLGKAVSSDNPVDLSQFEEYNPVGALFGQAPVTEGVAQEGTGMVLGKSPSMRLKGATVDEEGNLKYNIEAIPTEEELSRDADIERRKDIAKEDIKGLPIETGGKLAMVKQAKKDIGEVRKMLFPGKKDINGTLQESKPENFNRGLAFASNLPGSRAPILGAVIPQALPFHESGQKIYSRLQNAVAAKLRVETGAQANPSEVENILARFGVTSASSPEAAWDALQRLEDFMDETINITDPRGRFTGGKQTGSSNIKSKYGLE
jgi:hypothetical protein